MRKLRITAIILAATLIPHLVASQTLLVVGRTSYCISLDSAQKVARLDADRGIDAAAVLFDDLADCDVAAGKLIILGVISTHKVFRNGSAQTLRVYEAQNPQTIFYVLTTDVLVKEDPET